MKWDDIAKRLPGRSSISCRLRYQNYLEKRAIWDEEKKNKLARLYARYVQFDISGWPVCNRIRGRACPCLVATSPFPRLWFSLPTQT
jgi:hypothetical protein